MGAENQLLIDINQLTKTFIHRGNKIEVLKGIDLQIGQGEMCVVVGASGAGKSTFLHVLGTLDAPSAGQIRVNGKDTTTLPARELADFRNRTIGFVFQFHYLLPEFNALENTMMPGLIRKMDRKELEDKAATILGEVGLAHRLTHKPGELSGGEQQRVALARALVLRPLLLLADEPTGNLDAKTAGAIHDLLFQLNERYRTTMLLVTHNTQLARTMPRALLLQDGVIQEATGEQI
jgi:lipoprotein-releasing system ATP-binding protein